MKTEQEQIEKMARSMCWYCSTDGKCAVSKNGREPDICANVDTKHCLYKEYAERLIESGYGDVSEYKADNERLTKILNSLTFSKKETDIFGKPALLMFSGVKVEEAIKRVTEYNGLKAEIENLKDEIIYLKRKIAIRDNALKDRDKAIEMLEGKQDTIVKQAKIDVLKKIKNCREATDSDCYPYLERIVNKVIKEVQNGEDKG